MRTAGTAPPLATTTEPSLVGDKYTFTVKVTDAVGAPKYRWMVDDEVVTARAEHGMYVAHPNRVGVAEVDDGSGDGPVDPDG